MSISEFMSKDHKACDLLFAQAENAASEENWDSANQALTAFVRAMSRHFGIEELELFPAFEQATGMQGGPTQMMRMEHVQMRELFAEMQYALEQENSDDYLGAAETLLILMQQHNVKEEQILYGMIDRLPSASDSDWLQKFQDWS